MNRTKIEVKTIFTIITLFFIGFLVLPLGILFFKSIQVDGGIGFENYKETVSNPELLRAVKNSTIVSLCAAVITTIISFILSYVLNCTRIFTPIKKCIRLGVILPMLLPTITYGFAIIYSFGKQGLLTKIFGRELLNIYGFNGLLIGYVIYTLPSSFLLINNSFKYIDKKFIIVSNLMGDNSAKQLINTILRPLMGSIGGAFVSAFILSFTDFGIPAAVGGTYNVVSTHLYQVMLGAIPNFNGGAVIAILMLMPAILGVLLLNYLERFNFHYDKVTDIELGKNKFRDVVLGSIGSLIIIWILSIFIVMFITPFMVDFPYNMSFTLEYFKNTVTSNNILTVYKNSIFVAVLCGIFGTMVTYLGALINTRTSLHRKFRKSLDCFSMITNTVPGMVLGLAYLMLFNKTDLKGTFLIIIICNMVHFFTTPYLMAKNSLSKMNPSWETTGELLGDSWFKTLVRVVIPNSFSTIIEMFSYLFINSMVTISAIIFLVGTATAVMTTKIKELQHYDKFKEIFVLSILIFLTNLFVRLICDYLNKKLLDKNKTSNKKISNKVLKNKKKNKGEKFEMGKILKLITAGTMALTLSIGMLGCGAKSSDKVVIYTNADEEAIEIMQNTLNEKGYEDKYVLQSFGTSELGGKLIAEGDKIEADIVTMSSYFIESAQEKNNMFTDLTFDTKPLSESTKYSAPILGNTGSLFVNPIVIEEKNLSMPESIKDLTKPEFKDLVSIPNINDSSTAWLLVQAIISEYGEEEGTKITKDLVANAGPHIESSGSGPIKKVRAGEVAVGFGLRHQAVADSAEGKPIESIDPTEGNFTLTESIAVVNKKDEKKRKLAMEIAEVIVKDSREELIKYYPVALYEGETVSEKNKPKYSKQFEEKLSVDLLEQHQQFFNNAK